jgi:hypothetical protein
MPLALLEIQDGIRYHPDLPARGLLEPITRILAKQVMRTGLANPLSHGEYGAPWPRISRPPAPPRQVPAAPAPAPASEAVQVPPHPLGLDFRRFWSAAAAIWSESSGDGQGHGTGT